MSTTHIFAARHMRHATLARAHRVHPVVVSSGRLHSIPTVLALKLASLTACTDGGVLTASSTNTKATTTDTDAIKTRKDSFDLVDKLPSKVANVADGSISTSIPSTAVADESDTSSIVSLSSNSSGLVVATSDKVTKEQEQEHTHTKEEHVGIIDPAAVVQVQGQQHEDQDNVDQQRHEQRKDSEVTAVFPEAIGQIESVDAHVNQATEEIVEKFAAVLEHGTDVDTESSGIVTSGKQQKQRKKWSRFASAAAHAVMAPVQKASSSLAKSAQDAFKSLKTHSRRTFARRSNIAGTSSGKASKGGNIAEHFLLQSSISPLPADSSLMAQYEATGDAVIGQLQPSLLNGIPDIIADGLAFAAEHGPSTAFIHRSTMTSIESQVAVRTSYDPITGARRPGSFSSVATSASKLKQLTDIANAAIWAYGQFQVPIISPETTEKLFAELPNRPTQGFTAPGGCIRDKPLSSFDFDPVVVQSMASTLAESLACPSRAAHRHALEVYIDHFRRLLPHSAGTRMTAAEYAAMTGCNLFKRKVVDPFTIAACDIQAVSDALWLQTFCEAALMEFVLLNAPVFLDALAAADNINVIDEP